MAGTQIQFRCDAGIEVQISKRAGGEGSVSLVAKRDLERYYWLLQQAQQELILHTSELSLICDALNGTAFHEGWTVQALPFEVQDAIALRGLSEKWKVDGEALVHRLQSLTPLQLVALVDRVEQFWRKS